MANLHGFDATQVAPAATLDPIPAGKYVSVINESKTKPTKAGTGSYLALTFEIIEGECKGRLLWARLNLDNPNPKAVQIARAELSAICRAVGVLSPQDSSELHNLPLVAHVKCKKRDDTGEISNEIKGYSQRETPASNGQAVAGVAPPWKRI
jgi:uncharacterized protein DUF669